MTGNNSSAGSTRSQKGRHLPTICRVLGAFLVLAVFVLALPVTAPRLAGYEVYDVVSGSMEPNIPVHSAIYVHPIAPEDVEVDDVIAFNDGQAVIAHRVVVNRQTMGEFVTKGDANNTEDLSPIPYDALIGRVELSLPFLGRAMALYASNVGKIYLMLTFACGIMLNVLADRLRDQQRARQLREAREAMAQASGEGVAEPTVHRRPHTARTILMAILAAIFLCSAAVVGYVSYQHNESDRLYGDAASQYTRIREADANGEAPEIPPVVVDFEALQAKNPDVVGWIYCADTPIDYPVLLGKDNDEYLHHDYTGAYNIDGSIFLDSTCAGDFSLANTIIYGHHMGYTGSMFTCLKQWQEQSFYDEHPVMWLLTPTQDYRIDLFSGHHTDAYSDSYKRIEQPGEELDAYLQKALEQSYFKAPNVTPDPNAHYVLLSTCAYIFDNARFVMHGMLVPVDSMGGVPR